MTDNRVRVLHLVDSGWPGGPNTFVLELLRSIDRSRFQTGVCSISSEGPVLEEMSHLAEVFTLHRQGRFDWAAIGRYLHGIRAGGYDIVHAHFGSRIPRCTAKLAGCRVIAHAHGLPEDCLNRVAQGDPRLSREFKNSLGICADSIVACAHFVAQAFSRICPELESRISVIHNGVDLNQWRPVTPEERRRRKLAAGFPGNATVVGFAGRLIALKRVGCLLEAAQRLVVRHPDLYLLVLGDGPLRPELERQAQSLGGRCRFLGWCKSLDWFPLFDVLALPSESEGLPFAVLEAMALGIPVVASAVGGTPEAVSDGETGFLVPPGDSRALESALDTFIGDSIGNSKTRREMGLAGRARAENLYDSRLMARRFEELYMGLQQPSQQPRS